MNEEIKKIIKERFQIGSMVYDSSTYTPSWPVKDTHTGEIFRIVLNYNDEVYRVVMGPLRQRKVPNDGGGFEEYVIYKLYKTFEKQFIREERIKKLLS